MARTTRTSRPRRRSASSRPVPAHRPVPNTPGTVLEAAADTPAPLPAGTPGGSRTVRTARTAVPTAPRGLVTDYGYVVGELRRIVLLTVGILILLFVISLLVN